MVESDNKDYVPSVLSGQAPEGGGSPPGTGVPAAEAEGGFAHERLPLDVALAFALRRHPRLLDAYAVGLGQGTAEANRALYDRFRR